MVALIFSGIKEYSSWPTIPQLYINVSRPKLRTDMKPTDALCRRNSSEDVIFSYRCTKMETLRSCWRRRAYWPQQGSQRLHRGPQHQLPHSHGLWAEESLVGSTVCTQLDVQSLLLFLRSRSTVYYRPCMAASVYMCSIRKKKAMDSIRLRGKHKEVVQGIWVSLHRDMYLYM